MIKLLTGDFQAADWCLSRGCIGAFLSAEWAVVKQLTGTNQAAERHFWHGCVGAFKSAEGALVKGLTGTDEVVDLALNDQQSRK